MSKSAKYSESGTEILFRRKFMAGVAGSAAVALLPGKRLYAGADVTTIPAPPNFPPGIPLYQQTYLNWAQEINVPDVWTCAPRTPADVVALANWARSAGFRLRPLGSMHGFAPTILPRGSTGANYVLVNMMDALNRVTVNATGAPKSVTAQGGATLEQIARACEPFGLGFRHTPAPGGVTVAGGLAMNVHGCALPVAGETLAPGHSYGTLSNLILSMTVVAWDAIRRKYVLRTLQRNNPAIGSLSHQLGARLGYRSEAADGTESEAALPKPHRHLAGNSVRIPQRRRFHVVRCAGGTAWRRGGALFSIRPGIRVGKAMGDCAGKTGGFAHGA